MGSCVKMVTRVAKFILHACDELQSFVLAPTLNTSEKSQGVWFNTIKTILSMKHSNLLELAIFWPRPDRDLQF
jgi:hypothetical protein